MQAQQISTPVMALMAIMCLKGPPRPPCPVVHSTRQLLLQQSRLVATGTEQQQHSSLRACSELTAKQGWWLLWMSKTFSSLKQIWSWIRNYLRLKNSTWFHMWIHFQEFNHDFTGRRFAAALLPRLFGTNPRSHHKGATGRVRTGDQRLPVLCHCQLILYSTKFKY